MPSPFPSLCGLKHNVKEPLVWLTVTLHLYHPFPTDVIECEMFDGEPNVSVSDTVPLTKSNKTAILSVPPFALIVKAA